MYLVIIFVCTILILAAMIYSAFKYKSKPHITNTIMAVLGISVLVTKPEFKQDFEALFYILFVIYIILGIIPLIQFATRAAKK
ncbi:hypothetical protein GCM10008022_41280 [Paenibacillus hunanensis]|uniref:Uncharacterized protein n=1 Tax=Paenibacillus hunanensis TaxID=539262 RepID=A0ABU1J514_9BACL|nr:hypothetical protein [Paenibacillus hunanensis]GGJ28210.1 hypothetical protein GCM10008022_41280 [Paenibacillus hunanensis]